MNSKSVVRLAVSGWLLGGALFAASALAATPASPARSAVTRPAAVAAAATPAKPAAPLVDINSAGKEALMKLPAVGEAIAAKIVAGRPWASKAQLLSKGVLGKAAYNKVAPLIVARQPGSK